MPMQPMSVALPPGLPPPVHAQTPYADAEDLKELMETWILNEPISWHAEEAQENMDYNACRSASLSWIRYILHKHNATHLVLKAVTLLDALAVKSAWPNKLRDGTWWVHSNDVVEVGQLPSHIPAPTVLASLAALVRLTLKHDSAMPLDASQKLLGPAVLSGILDTHQMEGEPAPVHTLMRLIDQEEIRILLVLEGRTCHATPLEWTDAVMARLHCCVSSNFVTPLAEHWAFRLSEKLPSSAQTPPRALGVAACALALVASGSMEPLSSWRLHFQEMVSPSLVSGLVPADLLAQSATCSVNQMRLMVLDVTTAYLTATLYPSIQHPPEEHRRRLGSGSSSSTMTWSSPETLTLVDHSHSLSPDVELIEQHQTQITSQKMMTQSVQPQPNQSGNKVTLVVSHFPRAALAEDLRQVFCTFNVTGAQLILDRNGISRCYGFMRFRDHACAQQAFEACTRETISLDDAHGKTWILRANWANKCIPEDGTEEAKAARIQECASATHTTRCRRKRLPPTGLSRHT